MRYGRVHARRRRRMIGSFGKRRVEDARIFAAQPVRRRIGRSREKIGEIRRGGIKEVERLHIEQPEHCLQ